MQAAHPLDGGRAAVLHRSLDETAAGLGRDGDAYAGADAAVRARAGTSWRRSCSERRGCRAIRCWPHGSRRAGVRGASGACDRRGSARRGPRAAGRDGGALDAAARPARPPPRSRSCCWRSATPVGWPVARGGSAGHRRRDGAPTCARSAARSRPGVEVRSLADLPEARALLFDVTPRQLVAICGEALPGRLRGGAAPLPLRRRACSSSTTPSPARCRGRPRPAAGPERCTSAARSAEIAAAEAAVVARRPSRAPVRPRRPAEPGRPRPRAGGPAHAVGLLPRAQRLDRST